LKENFVWPKATNRTTRGPNEFFVQSVLEFSGPSVHNYSNKKIKFNKKYNQTLSKLSPGTSDQIKKEIKRENPTCIDRTNPKINTKNHTPFESN
jgi:hypothetical protein